MLDSSLSGNKVIDFFFDIDGTILPFGKTAPESAVNAIRSLRKAGNRAFLATGRSPVEVNPDVYAIGFDGGVFSAGAEVIADGKTIFRKVMTEEEKDRVLSYCSKKGFRVLVQTEKGTYLSASTLEFWTEKMRQYAGAEVVLSSLILTDELPPDAEAIKLLYVTDDYPIELIRKELGSSFSVVENTVGLPSNMMGEIVMSGITKATGIDRVLEYFGDSISSSAAFGDGANDIEMVEHAALGVAMGNASPSLKAVADWIAPAVDEDGLCAGIEYVMKILG